MSELPVHRPDLSALNRHFGQIQDESRGLRSRVEGQSEQIERIREQLERLASSIESSGREQQELANAVRSLRGLLKGLLFGILFLLAAVVVMSTLILFHTARL